MMRIFKWLQAALVRTSPSASSLHGDQGTLEQFSSENKLKQTNSHTQIMSSALPANYESSLMVYFISRPEV